MGRRKSHRIRIREERLERLDETKMEVAIWLLAKKAVEDRTQRSRPAPPKREGVNIPSVRPVDTSERSDTRKAAS